jgi:hypothetical protein
MAFSSVTNNMAAAIKAKATAHSALFVDTTGYSAPGTGNTGSPTGTGTADFLVGPDDIHPSGPAGCEYLARRQIQQIASLLDLKV